MALIGAGLADSAAWNRYANWAYYFIAMMGVGLILLVSASGWLQARCNYPATVTQQGDDTSLWFERCSGTVVAWVMKAGFDTLPGWRATWLAKMNRLWQILFAWQGVLDTTEHTLQRWTFAITVFLLLGIAVVFIGVLFWR